jgi:hypothetical protein
VPEIKTHVIPDRHEVASPESTPTGQRTWIPGSSLALGPGMTPQKLLKLSQTQAAEY